eukprot:Clim_evm51s25 gene=Clim_evmTU51s25
MSSSVLPVVYAVGILVAYSIFGYLEERVMQQPFPGADGEDEYFTYRPVGVAAQCVVSTIVAFIGSKVSKEPIDTTPQYLHAGVAVTYLGGMVASVYALGHVSYPAKILAKCCKPIPIMLLTSILNSRKYTIYKYITVALMVPGLALFMLQDEHLDFSNTDFTNLGTTDWLSVVGGGLLMLSLFLDGFTGLQQDHMRHHHKPSSYQSMMYLNFYASILALIGTTVGTGELWAAIDFGTRHFDVVDDIAIMAIGASVGQVFIFLLLEAAGPLNVSIVTTLRKFFSIIISVIAFSHPLNTRKMIGMALVFGGIAIDIYGGAKKRKESPKGKRVANGRSKVKAS